VKRIAELEFEIDRLTKLLEIAQLETVIERKKRERAEAGQFKPYGAWSVEYGDSTMLTDVQGAKDLMNRINDSYQAKHRG
jgi:hypothetical protein